MNNDRENDLLENEREENIGYFPSRRPAHDKLDARRLIERRLELRRLREQLEDPEFWYDFE